VFTRLAGGILALAGAVAVAACSVWWYDFYGAAAAGKASTFSYLSCLYSRPDLCKPALAAAQSAGHLVYDPLFVQLGIVALYFGALLLAARPESRALLIVDKISAGIGKTFGWTIIILTLGASYEVVVSSGPVRSVIDSVPTTWGYDFSYIMYGSLLLMTGAYTLSRNAHVRGDFLYRKWRPRVQAGMDLTIYIVGFLPAIVALIYAGYSFAAYSWQFHERSIFSPAGVPIYPLKTLIPIAAGLLLLQGSAEMIRCIVCLKTGAWPQRLADIEELETALMHQHEQMDKAEGKS
jgi:TRAP-type mannitol/chloroaromatic compound transport system permease small subunit